MLRLPRRSALTIRWTTRRLLVTSPSAPRRSCAVLLRPRQEQQEMVSFVPCASIHCRSLSSSPAPGAATRSSQFHHAKSKDLFDRITSQLTQDEVVVLADQINSILGRPVRQNEFYYRGFGGRRSGGAASGKASGADPDALSSAEGGPEAKKSSFDLKLVAFDASAKLKVIKEVRSMLGLGLKEAKELVESAPKVLQKGVAAEKAEELQSKLRDVGAEVELV